MSSTVGTKAGDKINKMTENVKTQQTDEKLHDRSKSKDGDKKPKSDKDMSEHLKEKITSAKHPPEKAIREPNENPKIDEPGVHRKEFLGEFTNDPTVSKGHEFGVQGGNEVAKEKMHEFGRETGKKLNETCTEPKGPTRLKQRVDHNDG